MIFADIHNHALFGVDDGAKNETETRGLIDASYDDGVRTLCFTPHFHPGDFGEHQPQISDAFQRAKNYAEEKYPDLALYLGNEIRYERSSMEWLEQGRCQGLNGTRNVLVDFLYPEPAERILEAMLRLLNAGYMPVLAHVERYESLHRDMREIDRMRSWGVIMQIDAQSPIGGLGYGAKQRSRRMLAVGVVDLVASDAHDLVHRPPQLRKSFEYISKKYGEEYARSLFWDEPIRLLSKEVK